MKDNTFLPFFSSPFPPFPLSFETQNLSHFQRIPTKICFSRSTYKDTKTSLISVEISWLNMSEIWTNMYAKHRNSSIMRSRDTLRIVSHMTREKDGCTHACTLFFPEHKVYLVINTELSNIFPVVRLYGCQVICYSMLLVKTLHSFPQGVCNKPARVRTLWQSSQL